MELGAGGSCNSGGWSGLAGPGFPLFHSGRRQGSVIPASDPHRTSATRGQGPSRLANGAGHVDYHRPETHTYVCRTDVGARSLPSFVARVRRVCLRGQLGRI